MTATVMKEIHCVEVPISIPAPLFDKILADMEAQGIDTSATRCDFVARGESVDAVMDTIVEHLSAEHGMKSWVKEYWVYVRAGIHDVEAV